ncbi:MAG: hypothetical protein ACRCZO_19170 [Cetobacterium sp.]
MKFRYLRKDEIEVKIQSSKDTGAVLVLYKNARVDMSILDETVGSENWEKFHEGNKCSIRIWSDKRNSWITKEDVGECTDSKGNQMPKGIASDAFKRAGFAWGIGRELYTSPFIWVKGKVDKFDKFEVAHILVEDGEIKQLQVCNSKTGELVYQLGTRDRVPNNKPKNDFKNETTETPKVEKKHFNKNAAVVEIMKLIAEDMDKLKKQLEFHKIKDLSEGSEIQLKTIYKFLRGGFNK